MLLVLPFLIFLRSVTCDYPWTDCNNVSTFAELSKYSQNLNTLINDLSRNTIEGFNKSSHGQSPDTVYGLFQCFGNASAAKCSDCSSQAYSAAQRDCGNDTGAQMWKDNCYLRYDNTNFSTTLNTTFIMLISGDNYSSNLEGFVSATSSLLFNLSREAASINKLFAVGSGYFEDADLGYGPQVVYGLAQCWRDLSIKDCDICLAQARKELKECCSSNTGGRAMSTSCMVRYELNPFFMPLLDLESSPSSPSPSTSPPKTSREKPSKTVVLILGFVGGMLLMLLIGLVALKKTLKSTIFGGSAAQAAHNEGRSLFQQEQRFDFSLEELAEATGYFDENEKIGEGGFGVVYKGRTKDGKEIAVKKLSAKSTQGNQQFMNEVKLVANVQHRNLVKLMGCCAERDERLIVYEYLPNKSLDTFLFDPEKFKLLDWQKRHNIILGIARGLLYLHEDSPMKIIHRDIKPSNILLDSNLNPKIADFGLARLFPELETHVQITVAGTWGYMAPEYILKRKLSVKADVYSFGLLLLEIISGQKNMDMNRMSEGMETIVERVWELYNDGNMLNMINSEVLEGCPEEQVSRFIHIGLLCVQDNAELRPPISIVILMLSSSSMPLPVPTEPGFLASSNNGVDSNLGSSKTSVTTTSSSSGFHKRESKGSLEKPISAILYTTADA